MNKLNYCTTGYLTHLYFTSTNKRAILKVLSKRYSQSLKEAKESLERLAKFRGFKENA